MSSSRGIASAILATAVLLASVAPATGTSEPGVPRAADDPAVAPATSGPDPGQGTEPSDGRELSLLAAAEAALRHNLEVRVFRFDREIAQEAVTAARAPFDPQIEFALPQALSRSTSPGASQLAGADVVSDESLTAGLSFSEQFDWGTRWSIDWSSTRFVTNNTFSTFNPRYNSSLSFNVEQPLLEGFGQEVNRQAILVSRNDLAESGEQFRARVQDVLLRTYRAYWELVFARRDLEVQESALDLARQQLERNRMQVRMGTLAGIETVQAEQRVADAEFQVAQARVAAKDAEDLLKQLINVEATSDWEVRIVPTDEPRSVVPEIDLQEAIATALENDPQIRQERIAADSRRIDLAVARNRLLPRLDLTGSFSLDGLGGDQIIRSGFLGGTVTEIQKGGYGDAIEQLFSGDFRSWSLGLTVSLPLNDWEAEAQHAQASIRERQARTRIARREQELAVAVRQAVRALETGAESVELARKARELAERQLDAEERKFAAGTTTNFQVLELQRQLSEARSRELRAIIDLAVDRAELDAARGTLLESLGVSIFDAGLGSPAERLP